MYSLAVYKKISDAWGRLKVLDLVRNQCCTKGVVSFFMKALLAIKLWSLTPLPRGYQFVRYKRFISKDSTEGVAHTEELWLVAGYTINWRCLVSYARENTPKKFKRWENIRDVEKRIKSVTSDQPKSFKKKMCPQSAVCPSCPPRLFEELLYFHLPRHALQRKDRVASGSCNLVQWCTSRPAILLLEYPWID